MDRVQLLLLGLPLFLFCSDLFDIFTPPPPPKPSNSHIHQYHQQKPQPQPQPQPQSLPQTIPEALEFPSQTPNGGVGGFGFGNTININFCSSCSYRGTAVTMKKMLDSSFPGVDVVLANHPPAALKRLLSKLVPVVQIGVIGVVMAGEQIFPLIGLMTPPPWYYSLRANKFGTMATTWLLGNVVQNFLQSTGAFEVYFNQELIFSKLKEGRFPGEIELRDLVAKQLSASRITDGVSNMWS